MARGLSLKGIDESHKMAMFIGSMESWDKRIIELETQSNEARAGIKRARDEVGLADDLELLELEKVEAEEQYKEMGLRIIAKMSMLTQIRPDPYVNNFLMSHVQ